MAATPNSVLILTRESWVARHGQPARRLPIKDATEAIEVLFDFGSYASTITSATVWAFVDRDAVVDTAPGAMLSGAPVIAGPVVTQAVTGGLAGNDYGLRCVVTTPSGEQFVAVAVLPVRHFNGQSSGTSFNASADFGDARNSMYVPALLADD